MSARPITQLRRQQVLAERAAEMRAAPTRSEAALWEKLRGEQLGVRVRRQVVLGQYVVDFLVPACRLVIEVDGGWHRHRRVADARRERALRRLGYRVLRLEAELVLSAPVQAVAKVREALAG
ncbi:MAG: DUF559 domain-containing protein [Myxococcales bacterium]|nr:DUF559 domain-containing protein [Myxococcales bacterium]